MRANVIHTKRTKKCRTRAENSLPNAGFADRRKARKNFPPNPPKMNTELRVNRLQSAPIHCCSPEWFRILSLGKTSWWWRGETTRTRHLLMKLPRHHWFRLSIALITAFFALGGAVAPSSQGATLITYFNFNDSNTTADPPGLELTPTIVPSPINGVTGFQFNAGTSVNLATGDPTGAGQALAVSAGPSLVNNGKSFQFTISTIGFTDLSLSYAAKSSSTGFTSQTLAYSTDGTTFTTFATVRQLRAS